MLKTVRYLMSEATVGNVYLDALAVISHSSIHGQRPSCESFHFVIYVVSIKFILGRGNHGNVSVGGALRR